MLLFALAAVGLLIGLALAGGVYVNELLDRVDQSEETSHMALKLTDIVEASDRTEQKDTTGIAASLQKLADAVKKKEIRSDKKVTQILLIGTDQQPGDKTGRADAILLLSIDPSRKEIGLTSFLRTMAVQIPGKGWSMLSHAYSWGGAPLLRQTIIDNFRVQIDDYMVVDFAGFKQSVDQVGGVDISLTEAETRYFRQYYPHLTVKIGANKMNGETALAFSRIRSIDSEIIRTSRQRRVVEALIAKAKDLSFGQITDLAIDLFPMIHTNLSKSQMLTLMVDGYKARTYDTAQLILPIEGTYQSVVLDQIKMIQADLPANVTALQDFVFGAKDGE